MSENKETYESVVKQRDELEKKLLAYEQAAKNPVAWMATDIENFPEYNSHNEFSAGCGAGTPLYAAPVLPKQPESESIICWSCKKTITLTQHAEADGFCPLCDAEIELEPAQPVIPEQSELRYDIHRDANRYRFLRDKDAFGDEGAPGLASWDDLAELDTGEFDSAVDARILSFEVPQYILTKTQEIAATAGVYAELYRLREEVKGPDGFDTWKDAAISEKKKRIEFERRAIEINYLTAMSAFHSDKWHKMDPITGYMHGWNACRDEMLKAQQNEPQNIPENIPAQPVIPRELCSFVTDADIAALHRFAECCDDPESGGHDLEKEQVQRLEKIGALQRSGRISYITDFGDYLISVTADERYRSEG